MGRPKGSKNKTKGVATTEALEKSIGTKGVAQAEKLHGSHDRDVLTYAVRTYPRLPAQTEALLSELSPAKAKEYRKELLKVV